MKLSKLAIPACLALCVATNAQAVQKSIYGDDNREEVANSSATEITKFSSAVAGMVDKRELKLTDDFSAFTFKANNLVESQYVSPNARFAYQNTLPVCTGFLIAPGYLMTAGHCITSDIDCENNYWVFDYDEQAAKDLRIEKRNVATCKRVVDRAQISYGPVLDFAIVELNWNDELAKREPVVLQRDQVVAGTEVAVMGHPIGLPMKIATDAKIRAVRQSTFIAPLDTFGGNSGSPVFNRENGEVIGILVQGLNDFKYGEDGYEYATYPQDFIRQETSTLVSATSAFELLDSLNSENNL